jgi:hypothetical protein
MGSSTMSLSSVFFLCEFLLHQGPSFGVPRLPIHDIDDCNALDFSLRLTLRQRAPVTALIYTCNFPSHLTRLYISCFKFPFSLIVDDKRPNQIIHFLYLLEKETTDRVNITANDSFFPRPEINVVRFSQPFQEFYGYCCV